MRTTFYAMVLLACFSVFSSQSFSLFNCIVRPTITVTCTESEEKIEYTAELKQRITGNVYGSIVFNYYQKSQHGMLVNLRVIRSERNKGYGSKLLKFALKKLEREHPECDVVKLLAKPLDVQYHKGEVAQDVIARLIAFYKRFGAHVTYRDDCLGVAQMEFRRTERI